MPTETPDPKPLFVYGDLRKGEKSHGEMKGSGYLGEVSTTNEYEKKPKGLAHGHSSVKGELYKVSPGKLKKLDDFELERYERRPVRLEGRDAAQAYLLKKSAGLALSVGDAGPKGKGVFADRDFEKGEVVETAPVVVVPRWQITSKDQLINYAYDWGKKDGLVLGYGSVYNHDDNPNLRYTKDFDKEEMVYTAARAIKKGDELTINYGGKDHYEMKFDGRGGFAFGKKLPEVDKTAVAAAEAFLTKRAKVKTELLPHQQRVVERIQQEDQPGLLVAHGLGSGKTLTSIAAQDALGMPATVILPAALQANYEKERIKHLAGRTQPISMTTLQAAARRGEAPSNPLLVVDEAHRLREPGTAGLAAVKGTESQKRLLLTATPFYNAPSDIAPLINVVSGTKTLPEAKNEFESRFVRERKVSPGLWGRLVRRETPGVVREVNPATASQLRDVLHKYVDYHPSSQEGFPSVTREDVQVPMEKAQLKVYDTLMKRAPPWVAAKVKSGLPPSKREAQELNAFLSGVRQVANTTAGFQEKGDPQSPKIQRAFEDLQKTLGESERAKAIVYSNFLESGINPYRSMLQQANIPYGEFTGEMPKRTRDQMVRDYNEGKLKALLLSSAGGEGLDLKGTRLIQVLEPHWNIEKIKQVEGRGVRYGSHTDLPEAERNVRIQRYLATRPPSGIIERLGLREPGGGVDEYLAHMSGEKERLHEQFRKLLPGYEKKASVEKDASTVEELREVARKLPKVIASKYQRRRGADGMHTAYGKVMAAPGGAWRDFATGGPKAKLRALSPQAKKGVNVVGVLHEGAELAAERDPTSRAFGLKKYLGHADPSVILNERNTIGGLTGPGAADTRRVFAGVRRAHGEAAEISNALRDVGGERAVEAYGDYGAANKIPKALRKRVREHMNEQSRQREQEAMQRLHAVLAEWPKKASEAPKGYYKGLPSDPEGVKFKVDFQGIEVLVERPKGFIMVGKDAKGVPWARRYKLDYGHIPKTLGGDGDGLDVFLGPDKKANEAYWAIQRKDDGTFDEYKVFLGFPDRDAATAAYRQHIPKKYLKGIITLKVSMMKAMLGKVEPEELMKSACFASFLDELAWLESTSCAS